MLEKRFSGYLTGFEWTNFLLNWVKLNRFSRTYFSANFQPISQCFFYVSHFEFSFALSMSFSRFNTINKTGECFMISPEQNSKHNKSNFQLSTSSSIIKPSIDSLTRTPQQTDTWNWKKSPFNSEQMVDFWTVVPWPSNKFRGDTIKLDRKNKTTENTTPRHEEESKTVQYKFVIGLRSKTWVGNFLFYYFAATKEQNQLPPTPLITLHFSVETEERAMRTKVEETWFGVAEKTSRRPFSAASGEGFGVCNVGR